MDAMSCGGTARLESRARQPAGDPGRLRWLAMHSRAPPQVGALVYDTSERDMHGDR
jgi:hypothetical protein